MTYRNSYFSLCINHLENKHKVSLVTCTFTIHLIATPQQYLWLHSIIAAHYNSAVKWACSNLDCHVTSISTRQSSCGKPREAYCPRHNLFKPNMSGGDTPFLAGRGYPSPGQGVPQSWPEGISVLIGRRGQREGRRYPSHYQGVPQS